MTVTSKGLPWRISFTSYNATTDVVAGTVSGVKVVLTGSCDAAVNGSSGSAADGVVSAVYNDRIGQLIDQHFGYECHDDADGVLSTLTDDIEHDVVGFPGRPAPRHHQLVTCSRWAALLLRPVTRSPRK